MPVLIEVIITVVLKSSVADLFLLIIFTTGPQETDPVTLEKESVPGLQRKVLKVQQRAGATTRWRAKIGRTGRTPPQQTQPRAKKERDPFPTSGTGAPAPRSESPAKYELDIALQSLSFGCTFW